MNSNLIVRLRMQKRPNIFSAMTAAVEQSGGEITSTVVSQPGAKFTVRDVMVTVAAERREGMLSRLKGTAGLKVLHVSDEAFLAHLGGKLKVSARRPLTSMAELSAVYTPGVGPVCEAIAADPNKVFSLTMKGNCVGVVTDGSRVLSLGNIGARAALPVMEGKALLFEQFGGINAFPICIDDQDTEAIIAHVKAIAPVFGAINLEDIESPKCYEIERRLQRELDIPVLHDDQHGTAVVVTAATLNAVKLVRKRMADLKVVACGVGAAGFACCKMLIEAGVRNLIGFNRNGAVYKGRKGLTAEERWLANHSNPTKFRGTMQEALVGADMFLGLSVAGAIKAEDLQPMRRDAIVFALANPIPEVLPEDARRYARVIATGGSNYPNQINNALSFPGLFRGALDCRAKKFTDEMKMAAARALASVIETRELDDDLIIPNVFDTDVVPAVSEAVRKIAIKRGLARRTPKD